MSLQLLDRMLEVSGPKGLATGGHTCHPTPMPTMADITSQLPHCSARSQTELRILHAESKQDTSNRPALARETKSVC